MLSELGYRVLKAKDAESALAIVESGVPIDLLFTDVVMPGPLRSPELARKAQERLPGLAVLFTSGYTENAIVHGGRLDEGIELLSKPYSREALARKIQYVLRNQPQRRAAEPDSSRSAQRQEASEGRPAASGPLRVLLVEDDALIRLSTVDMLENLGHSVEEAGDAPAALERLDKGVFDVLVTDVKLPGMSGEDLAASARATPPRPRRRLRDRLPDGAGRGPARGASRRGGAPEALRRAEHRLGAEKGDGGQDGIRDAGVRESGERGAGGGGLTLTCVRGRLAASLGKTPPRPHFRLTFYSPSLH